MGFGLFPTGGKYTVTKNHLLISLSALSTIEITWIGKERQFNKVQSVYKELRLKLPDRKKYTLKVNNEAMAGH